jgi:D-3-phosphoglycerate dehydrogenase / 2-oxoglutarate reductase
MSASHVPSAGPAAASRARRIRSAAAERTVYVYDPMDAPLDWLGEHGITVTRGAPVYSTGQMRPKIPEDEIIERARGHAALMGASGTRITRRVMEALPELGYISKLGIGCEIIDLRAATELGVMVTNTPVHSEVEIVAEHAIALMLGLLKQLHWYGRDRIRAGGWKDPEHMSGSVRDATVGIVGLGKTGRAVARRLAGWEARLIATDVAPVAAPDGLELVPLERLLAESDIVTLHATGASPGSPPLLDDRRLGLMRPSAILVNAARGNLVDTDALVRRLRDGLLAGAAIDVFDPEPPDRAHPLLALPNVLLTPHVAAWNRGLRSEMALMAYENVWEMFEGRVPAHLVNTDVVGREA